MFVRVKRSVHDGRVYEYLQIARTFRAGGKVRQEVIATLGRRDELVASGEVDRLLQGIARFSERLRVVERIRTEGVGARVSKLWGPPLVFGRLWEQQGLPEILERLATARKFVFEVERVAFAMALQRLCRQGSDLQGSRWLRTVEAPGFESIELHHLYRTCRFLSEVRSDLEAELFHRDRTLFDQELDLVFVDTTSVFVYRDTETSWRKRGYSRDRHPELPQFVLAVAVDRESWPIAWEILPGNTADTKGLRAIIEAFRKRFRIGRVMVVGDRGMFGEKTFSLLTEDDEHPFDYIVGCRMRNQKEVRNEALSRGGRYHTVTGNLEVKEVVVGSHRYVVCRNPEEAKKDAVAREAIVGKLRQTLDEGGAKGLVANKGYARFLKSVRGGLVLDEKAVAEDERFDGKFVLTTNTDLPADEVALGYKGLWRVERTFREEKSTLEVRPIFHHTDSNSIGHIVASFLALRLEVDLQRRLDAKGLQIAWPDLMSDLGQVQAVTLDLDGERYRLRTDLAGQAHLAFVAAGLRPPPPLGHLGSAPSPEPEPEIDESTEAEEV